jgi:NADH:ubiquinone oxidoreductase subunit E
MNSEKLKARLQSIVADYPHPQAALTPVLHYLLETEQPIDNDTIALAGELCNVDVRSVLEIVGYYPVFENEPTTHTDVCFGLPCYLNGAPELLAEINAGLSPGNGSLNKIKTSACLGHCYAAPVVRFADGTMCRGIQDREQ